MCLNCSWFDWWQYELAATSEPVVAVTAAGAVAGSGLAAEGSAASAEAWSPEGSSWPAKQAPTQHIHMIQTPVQHKWLA